jgi:hypothetical protein
MGVWISGIHPVPGVVRGSILASVSQGIALDKSGDITPENGKWLCCASLKEVDNSVALGMYAPVPRYKARVIQKNRYWEGIRLSPESFKAPAKTADLCFYPGKLLTSFDGTPHGGD